MIVLLVTVAWGCFSGMAAAEIEKRTLRGDMTEIFGQLPGEAAGISGMFRDGLFYGRLRASGFLWDWDREEEGRARDHWSAGVGGSVIFKSAWFNGVGVTAGFYTSRNPWRMGGDDCRYAKAGKDTFSRYAVVTQNSWDMTVLARAHVDYRFRASRVRVGRQLFESLLVASNDTKMIPNAFSGVSFEAGGFSHTRIKAAWFDRQKLRDHVSFHHVLAYGDDPEGPNAAWSQNDDSAMHKGLTLSKLKAAGIKDELVVLQVENDAVRGGAILLNYTGVPDLVGAVTGEIGYSVDIGGGFKLGSGIRYLSQFDYGAGNIGGASLKGAVSDEDPGGYRKPSSLEGSMVAVKISVGRGNGKILAAYSKVADGADLVAPWRGAPTGGYTRAMAQYNWYSNTESWMLQFCYDFVEPLVSGLRVKIRYAVQDYDDGKPAVPADSRVLNIDFVKKMKAISGLELKIRTNFVDGNSHTVDMTENVKPDLSLKECRFEVNYLF